MGNSNDTENDPSNLSVHEKIEKFEKYFSDKIKK